MITRLSAMGRMVRSGHGMMIARSAVMNDGSMMLTTETTIPMWTTRCIITCVKIWTSMSATIAEIDSGVRIVEMAGVVMMIDGQQPGAAIEGQRAEEIVGCHKQRILPVVQNVAKIGIAVRQIVAIDVACRLHTQKIVQVDLIAIVILLIVEIQLIGHLVR